MKNGQIKLNSDGNHADRKNELLVGDVVRYLDGLAKIHGGEKIGNPELSVGLQQVVRALRPYSDLPVMELTGALGGRKPGGRNAKAVPGNAEEYVMPDVESLSQEDVAGILDSENCDKRQIVDLGALRFGISRSKLERLSKKDALDSVRSALEHEKSLDAISREAKRSGMARTA